MFPSAKSLPLLSLKNNAQDKKSAIVREFCKERLEKSKIWCYIMKM